MEHERARAAKLGYEDPIQPTAEATHANYTEALELLLSPPRRASTVRVPPCTRRSSTPAPPQGAPGLAPLDRAARHSQSGAQHVCL